MVSIRSLTGYFSSTQKTMTGVLEVYLALMVVSLLSRCDGKPIRNLYDPCPSRRHHNRAHVTLEDIAEMSNMIKKKAEQLQDDYQTSGRIMSHGDREFLETIKFEQLPETKSYEEEAEMIFETYHGLVKYYYFLELSQNGERLNYGIENEEVSFHDDFKEILQGHYDPVYNMQSLLCQFSSVIQQKDLWTDFLKETRVNESVLDAASKAESRQSQLRRDYVFLHHFAHYLNHVKNQAPLYLNSSW